MPGYSLLKDFTPLRKMQCSLIRIKTVWVKSQFLMK
jgi:hypothetical protein